MNTSYQTQIKHSTLIGYPTSNGYLGYVPEEKRKILFSTEDEYREYLKEHTHNETN